MSSIPWLQPADLRFPSLDRALSDPNGLLAVGGDLSIPRLLEAYSQGIFPWYEEGQPILWWSPSPRAVLFPEQLHINRSLTKALRRDTFHCTTDRAFGEVIGHCAKLSSRRPGTWITDDMRRAYTALYAAGWAHSVEVWQNTRLVGGLYGVALGKIFFGESMFSLAPNGSKIALCALSDWLQQRGFALIDCQVGNPYLFSMGAREIPRDEFRQLLSVYTKDSSAAPGHWDWHWSNP